MKKLISTGLACVAIWFAAGSFANAQTSNPGSLENRAIAASHECLQGLRHGHHEVVATLIAQGHCINGGTVNIYEVKVVYYCPPQVLTTCLPAPPVVASHVSFGCENKLDGVTCF